MENVRGSSNSTCGLQSEEREERERGIRQSVRKNQEWISLREDSLIKKIKRSIRTSPDIENH